MLYYYYYLLTGKGLLIFSTACFWLGIKWLIFWCYLEDSLECGDPGSLHRFHWGWSRFYFLKLIIEDLDHRYSIGGRSKLSAILISMAQKLKFILELALGRSVLMKYKLRLRSRWLYKMFTLQLILTCTYLICANIN